MKKTLYILVLVLLCNLSYAQPGKEAWHWEMGNYVSLDFNATTVTSGSSSIAPLHTYPFNSICISDPNTGQLLFYSDGITIWDKNNNPMPHGNLNDDSLLKAIIIPAPCSNKYYLIAINGRAIQTFAPTIASAGIYYSVIDMNLHNGLGDVTLKNMPFPNAEYLTKGDGVRHANQRDYWFITHGTNSNTFYTYLIGQNGISSSPVISNVGSVLKTNYTYSNTPVTISNYLKVSPNGKRLAIAHEDGSNNYIAEIYDFDNATGIITNPITLTFPPAQPFHVPCGLSFSPDNTKLYATFAYYNSGSICQYNLSSNNAATILSSEYSLSSSLNFNHDGWGDIQMGPDRKIYAFGGEIAVINSPDSIGSNCNPSIWPIYPNSLPDFMDGGFNPINPSYFGKTNIVDTEYCINSHIILGSNYSNYSNFNWSTGANTQTLTINNIGKYWVTYENQAGCYMHDTFNIQVQQYPKFDLGNDSIFCKGEKTLRASYDPKATYLWNTGQKTSYLNVNKPGIYWVTENLNGCISTDTLIFFPAQALELTYPNIITPNGDNINDYIVFGNDLFSSLHIDIYNRWGKKIFTSDDPQCIWYPDEDNEILDAGTCYYVAQYNISCGNSSEFKTLKGFISVIK